MKHIVQKIISGLLAVSTLLFSVPIPHTNAVSDEESYWYIDGEENSFRYRLYISGSANGTVEITGYTEAKGYNLNRGIVEIPSEINGHPVTTIRRAAFAGCGHTDEFYHANDCLSEETHGCSGCGITEIIIPDSVTTIQDGTFENCESLVKIHFPSGLKDFYGTEDNRTSNTNYIGFASWIANCDALEELTISENNPYYQSKNGIIYSKDGKTIGPVPPAISFDDISFDGITAIGDFAFCGRESQLINIEIPSNITSIGNYAFTGYGGDYYNDHTDNVDGAVNIKLNEGLTAIGDYAFSNMYFLKKIDMPDSLVSLGKGAFSYDNQLQSIVIPPKVTKISDYLFEDCRNLKSVTLSDGITEIGKYAFYGSCLTEIQLPSSLKKIDDCAFLGGTLQSIIIPDSVEYIGEHAFEQNRNLRYVKLSKNLKKIEAYSFSNCGIRTLEIPEGVTEIGEEAFAYGGLISLKLPETLLKIGNGAFKSGFVWDWQGGNKSIKIPDNVTEIGSGAFSNCYLSDIELPDHPVSMNTLAFISNNLSSVIFPEGTTNMTLPLVMGNEKLNRIYLPKSLKELSPLAIAKDGYSRLVEVNHPYEANSYAFYDLVMVSDIYFAGTEAEWDALIKDWDFSEYDTDPSVMDNVTVHFNAAVESDVKGDVNADGVFNIADVVMMQRWLLDAGRLVNWKAGDLCQDDTINVFDLCLMKRALLE